MSSSDEPIKELTRGGRIAVLVVAFLGWMFAGTIMVIVPLAGRPALISMGVTDEGQVGNWFAWYICAFLLGAAAGGWLLGTLGDRIGRAKAMGASILWYSIFTGVMVWVETPTQFLVLRFVACMGVGGMWPNGVALASESWSNVSRPLLAGLIGTSANLGFVYLGMLSSENWINMQLSSLLNTDLTISPDNWRWVMIVGALPAPLGLIAMTILPESPRWLAQRNVVREAGAENLMFEVFRPPLLKVTLLGIVLGTIPLLGNWGGANWLVPWADQVGGEERADLESRTQTIRSAGAALGSLLGGWLAAMFGRRTTYFAISLFSLASSAYLFWFLTPNSPNFLWWVFILGFFGTVFFGWLPLYLPELFPTHIRSTGSGVTFNFGRIFTAFGVLGVGEIMRQFDGDYARVGQVTSLVYLLGMIIICFAPDTSKRQLDDD